ncbi:hypothetical protein HPP92_003765 [Vanilla planifolia]|uniref:Uncharacterized protein n=1 Tax=Vanilla planifolia TaxID=51239 RepID=A0A835VFS7_VANPL|nr:hypothetical protein HPP92_003765 [Vanilla planifolia]
MMSSPDSQDDEESTVSSSPRHPPLDEDESTTVPSPIEGESPYDFESSCRIGMVHITRGLEIASGAIDEFRGRDDSATVVAKLTRLIQSVREDNAKFNDMVAGKNPDLVEDRD